MPRNYQFPETNISASPGAIYVSPVADGLITGNHLPCPTPIHSASAHLRVPPASIHLRPASSLARAISSLKRRKCANGDSAHAELCCSAQNSGARDISMPGMESANANSFLRRCLVGENPNGVPAAIRGTSRHDFNLVLNYFPSIKMAFNLYFCPEPAKHPTSISLVSFLFM
jgi:hypothetical protein